MSYFFATLIGLMLIMAACTAAGSGRQQPETGLLNNRLRPCPSSPNCVCSEYPGTSSFIPPLTYTVSDDQAWEYSAKAVISIGGQIISRENGYLHATFSSRIFGFVDDLELRLDRENKAIHLRSASRTGYYDFGVNRSRADRLRKQFQRMQQNDT